MPLKNIYRIDYAHNIFRIMSYELRVITGIAVPGIRDILGKPF